MYYRLHVFELEIPPLRIRKADIRELVLEHRDLLRNKTPGPGFWQALQGHDWPGNVRELLTVLTRAGVQLTSPITGEQLKRIIQHRDIQGAAAATSNAPDLWARLDDGGDFWTALWPMFIKRELNKQQLRRFLREEYLTTEQSLKQLSTKLKIAPSEFKKFIAILHKYDIHPGKSYPAV